MASQKYKSLLSNELKESIIRSLSSISNLNYENKGKLNSHIILKNLRSLRSQLGNYRKEKVLDKYIISVEITIHILESFLKENKEKLESY